MKDTIHAAISYHSWDLEPTLLYFQNKFGRGIGILCACPLAMLLRKDLCAGFLPPYTCKISPVTLRQQGWVMTHTDPSEIQVEFTDCQTENTFWHPDVLAACLSFPVFVNNFSSHVGKSLEALDQYIQSPKTCLFQFPNLPPPNKQTKKSSLFILGVCRRILFTNGYKMLQHEGKVQILSSTFSPQLSFFSVWRNIIYYEPRHNHWS